jgi:hypothetical protein
MLNLFKTLGVLARSCPYLREEIFFCVFAMYSFNFGAPLKYPVTILLLFVVTVQTFSKNFLVLGYEINKDFIAKNLCENRSKPCCCCKGKCFLGKKLAADDKQQSPSRGAQREQSPLQWLPVQQMETAHLFNDLITPNLFFNSAWHPQACIRAFFHPPQS